MRSPYEVVREAADHDWRSQAACLQSKPDLFFPVGGTDQALSQVDRAKQVCADCPVRTHCLSWANRTGVSEGVWGGLSAEERKSLKRRNDRQRYRENSASNA